MPNLVVSIEYGIQSPEARFLEVPKSFHMRKAVAKTQTLLWLQSCVIRIFFDRNSEACSKFSVVEGERKWTVVLFIQKVSGYTLLNFFSVGKRAP